MNEFGAAAYDKAAAAERVARRKQDKRLSRFLAEVLRQIAKDGSTPFPHSDHHEA
jgi:hypothetical protein